MLFRSIAKIRPLIWEQENDWRVMLGRVIVKNNLQKNFIIPEANVENITTINSQNIKNISFSDIEKTLIANGSEAGYLLFFNVDEIENKVLIEVVYLRKLLKRQFRLSFINVDRLSYNDLLIKVAEKTLEYISNNAIGSDNILDKNNMNAESILKWLNNNPEKAAKIMHLNESYIFFTKRKRILFLNNLIYKKETIR